MDTRTTFPSPTHALRADDALSSNFKEQRSLSQNFTGINFTLTPVRQASRLHPAPLGFAALGYAHLSSI